MITKMWEGCVLHGQRGWLPAKTCDICNKYVIHYSAFKIPMYYRTLPAHMISYSIHVARKDQIYNLDLAWRLDVFKATVHNNERFYFV